MTTEAPTGAASGERSLGVVAARAVSWSFVNTAVSRLGTLGIGIFLARLLGPAAFGTYAVATVALLAVLSFNELGVSLAIVRWQGDPKVIAPTVATISVLSSLLLTAGVFVAAPAFSAAMGDPRATSVVRLLGLCIVISGLVATPAALLQRDFRQGRRMVIDQINVWFGAILSIVLAVGGMGAMSLAIGRLAATLVSAGLFILLSPAPFRFGFDRSQLRSLIRFGLPLAGSSIVVFAVGYADQLSAGAILGSTALGYYVLAFNLASWPVSMFSQPLRSVAPAAFARLQHDPPSMLSGLRSIIGLLAALTVPICLLLAGAASPVIHFVYGSQWSPAAPVLSWLAILAAFRIFFELVYDYLVVVGRSRVIFFVQLIWLVILLPALVIAARFGGLNAMAPVQVGVAAAVILPLYLREIRRQGLSTFDIVRRVVVPLTGGAAVGGIALILSHTIESDVMACLVSGVVCLAVVAALIYRDRRSLTALRRVQTGYDRS